MIRRRFCLPHREKICCYCVSDMEGVEISPSGNAKSSCPEGQGKIYQGTVHDKKKKRVFASHKSKTKPRREEILILEMPHGTLSVGRESAWLFLSLLYSHPWAT